MIIANYNYAEYLSEAITSALELAWPDVEVIVVDDASSDGSADVIRSFGDRVTPLLAEVNAGQRAACNWGFTCATGDVIVFLDADDQLEPSFAERVMGVWTPATSKVQVQMLRVGPDGRPFGPVTPRLRSVPTPDEIRRWWRATSAYPTPPGSGNAFARRFLDRIMPIDARAGDAMDSALLAAAPGFGDVHTVAAPLVRYRIHDRNDSDLLADPTRFDREVRRAVARQQYVLSVLPREPADDRLRRSRELLQFRVAAFRATSSGSSFPGDGRAQLLLDAARSASHPGPEAFQRRLAVAAWCILVAIAPPRIAESAIRWRYSRH